MSTIVSLRQGIGSWESTLPNTVSPNGYAVTITVGIGEASAFVNFDESTNTFTIEDLNDLNIVPGTYNLEITLDDTALTSVIEIKLTIDELCSEAPEIRESASINKFAIYVEENTFIEQALPKY